MDILELEMPMELNDKRSQEAFRDLFLASIQKGNTRIRIRSVRRPVSVAASNERSV